ncbi:pirin family protein [Thiobacillus denitrificans]|uniref:pirin family protein n=1 Tax=Thiobacillus denitrificans TaxID=36861 RepID=UPI00035DD469|nr:pirin family protein [Thiobacillus denitrificans]
MTTLRPSNARGHANHGWLDSYHTFSFARYYDPAHMGVSNLRVINDDTVMPGQGFGTHGHQDMEIVSYVLDGALEHQDSMGNGSIIRPGDIQRMSAGTGVRHSEYNASKTEPVHFLQIWLVPNREQVAPGYDQKHFPLDARRGRLVLLVSPDGRDGSLSAHQDGLLYGTVLEAGEAVEHPLAAGRRAYVHVARGQVAVNGTPLGSGDGATLDDVAHVHLEGLGHAEVLLFDLP